MIDIDKAIAAAVKTGKVSFGANSAIQNVKTGKAKLVILASNCPKAIKDEIEYYCRLSKVPALVYKGASMDLAALCGKLFSISVLSVREMGDAELLKMVEGNELEKSNVGNE